MALQLAAPHTWPAAILPVLFAVSLAAVTVGSLSVTLALALLVICVLMQASVNTLNDYYDFVKGADSIENQLDPTDAVLVYNNVNPKAALALAIGFLGAAFLLGVYVIFVAGWIPLVIGLVGAGIIVLYSAGKSPLSYLPVGEFVSGITMGGLIPLACYQALTGEFSWLALLLSLPLVCGIGLIMFTNNTCDIEKDNEADRKTLSVLLGRERARTAYHAVIVVWAASIVVFSAVFFPSGLIVIPFMLVALYPAASALWKNPLTPATRLQAMLQCLNLNIALGAFYAAAILMGGMAQVVL
ncbi:prenyltransferase [Raoultibacter phocaeensis]|uniref:prenyltransferase n=1 Tax=Raoultibacter phocaeensis TaxID=2479841 RepID=UPI001119A6CC|nr:prenyltransferase [Raoultibacter phocaeensis]